MLKKIILGQKKAPVKKRRRKRKSAGRVDWQEAKDIKERIEHIVDNLDMDYIDVNRVYCFRSQNSKARAYARIWGFSKIWQLALDLDARYCLEILSEKFDHLSDQEKSEVLIHELCHIPKNFSGSLMPHTRKGKNNFHDRVHQFVRAYKRVK